MKFQKGITMYQFLHWPRNDTQSFKHKYQSGTFCIQNTKLVTGFFIDILKADTISSSLYCPPQTLTTNTVTFTIISFFPYTLQQLAMPTRLTVVLPVVDNTCCYILKLQKYHSRCCQQQFCLVTLYSSYSTITDRY